MMGSGVRTTDVSAGGWRALAALVAVWLLAMVIWVRVPLASGFDLGFSDRADGIIEISILEHWRNVLLDAATWDRPLYFHPDASTLGYNDGYLLYGLVYSFWRLFFDPFLSDTLNIATFKTIGFFATYGLVTRTLGWERPIALLVALIFTVSNNLMVQAGHAQVQSITLLPLLAILAIAAWRAGAAGRDGRARLLGSAAAALMAAWLLTAFYMAWFTLFFTAVLALCWLFTSGPRPLHRAAGLVRAQFVTLAVIGAVFLLCALPFLLVYLPKVRETGGQSYWKMLGYLATPGIDWINVGTDNYLWGWIFRLLHALVGAIAPRDPALPGRVLANEHDSGFPLILFALAVTALWRVLRRGADQPRFLRAFALAVFVSWLLTIQLWVLSPWGLVFELVPGAKGMRVVLRYQLFLVLPVLLLVFAVYRERAMELLRTRPVLAVAAAVLLLVEQLNGSGAAQLRRSEHLAALEGIPRPPADCAAFYVVATRVGEPLYRNEEQNGKYPHNVDAMFLAQRWRIPTVNGYSTFTPPGWDFRNPLAPDYEARVATYAARYHLPQLCRLDMRDAQPWQLRQFPAR